MSGVKLLRRGGTWAAFIAASMLSACGQSDDKKAAQTVPVELKKADALPENLQNIDGVTPMDQRIAQLGLLNKRNGLVTDLTMKPGTEQRVGNVLVRLRACETTAPWENTPETGAFVQLVVKNQRDSKWYRVFSGWVFRERPERNVIQHPIYDVFVKSCAMTYPGGEAVERAVPSDAANVSNAPQSPAGNGGDGNGAATSAAAPATAAAASAPAAAATAAAPTTPSSDPANNE